MNTHIEDAKKCLQDNNARGMSASHEPYHWNLHNAIAALTKAFEEETGRLEAKVSQLESQLRNMR